MSDYTIRARIDMLRQQAAVIADNADVVQSQVSASAAEVDALRHTFLGNRARKFFAAFDNARQDMERWDDIVRSFAAELEAAAARLEAADNG